MKDLVRFETQPHAAPNYLKTPYSECCSGILNILETEVNFTELWYYKQHKGEDKPIVKFEIERPNNTSRYERVGFYLDILIDPPSWSTNQELSPVRNTLAEFSIAACPANCMYGYMCYVDVYSPIQCKGIGRYLIQWAQRLLRHQEDCGVALCTTTHNMLRMHKLLIADGWSVIHERGNNNSGNMVQKWVKELDSFNPQ